MGSFCCSCSNLSTCFHVGVRVELLDSVMNDRSCNQITIRSDGGYVVIEQDADDTVSHIELTPEQCAFVCEWIMETEEVTRKGVEKK